MDVVGFMLVGSALGVTVAGHFFVLPFRQIAGEALAGWRAAEDQNTRLIGYLHELKERAPHEFDSWAAERETRLH